MKNRSRARQTEILVGGKQVKIPIEHDPKKTLNTTVLIDGELIEKILREHFSVPEHADLYAHFPNYDPVPIRKGSGVFATWWARTTYTKCCPKCGREFEYELKHVKRNEGVGVYELTCPHCGRVGRPLKLEWASSLVEDAQKLNQVTELELEVLLKISYREDLGRTAPMSQTVKSLKRKGLIRSAAGTHTLTHKARKLLGSRRPDD